MEVARSTDNLATERTRVHWGTLDDPGSSAMRLLRAGLCRRATDGRGTGGHPWVLAGSCVLIWLPGLDHGDCCIDRLSVIAFEDQLCCHAVQHTRDDFGALVPIVRMRAWSNAGFGEAEGLASS